MEVKKKKWASISKKRSRVNFEENNAMNDDNRDEKKYKIDDEDEGEEDEENEKNEEEQTSQASCENPDDDVQASEASSRAANDTDNTNITDNTIPASGVEARLGQPTAEFATLRSTTGAPPEIRECVGHQAEHGCLPEAQ